MNFYETTLSTNVKAIIMSSHAPIRFLSRKTPPHIATLMCLAGLSTLAMNVFLPSLPGMTEYFGTTPAVMGLSVGVYLGVNAILQLFIGPVSDKYGRRPVILGGIILYLLATLGCLFSSNVYIFLMFRMMQSTIAVAMVLSRAVVRDTTPPEQAGSKIAYVTMGMAVVPMIGPAIGGFLENSFGWQANFWLLFAVGLAILCMTWADLGETAQKSGNTLAQQFSEYPELLRSQRFWGYCLASAFGSGTFFAFLGGAPFVGVHVFDLDPRTLGLYFGAPSIGYFLGNYLTGAYSIRIGINRLILWGSIATTLACAISLLLSLTGMQTLHRFFGLMIIVGLGNGLVIPNATAGMLSVRAHLAGTASGLGGSMMLLGGACLSAMAGLTSRGGTSAAPLLWIMTLSALVGVIFILLVIRRQKQLPPVL